MKRIMLLATMLFIFAITAYTSNSQQEYTAELAADSIDSYDMPMGGRILRPTSSTSPYFEKTRNIPGEYTLQHTYSVPLQARQRTFQKFLADSTARNRFFQRFPDQSFEDWQKKYSSDSLDNIASIGAVENPAGELVLIYDANNDEDLSNDPIIQPVIKSRYIAARDTSYEFSYMDGEVQFEYYDGSTIRTGTRTLRLRWVAKERGLLSQTSATGQFGRINIHDTSYRVGLINRGDIEYSKYDNLWIDLNQNDKYDRNEDHYEQMYLPFTIDTLAYKVTEVGRFGQSLALRSCDPDSIPPIAEGLPAPDFQATTIDSSQLQLSDFIGKFIVLDFWTCNSPRGLSRFYDIYKDYQDRQEVAFISVGPYTPERYQPEIRKIEMNWPHIDGLFDVPARELYQVAGENVTFIINPDGKIMKKLVFAPAEKINNLLAELL